MSRRCNMAQVFRQRLAVPFDFPVVFTRGVFRPGNPVLSATMGRLEKHRVHRALVFVDSGIARTHRRVCRDIGAYFKAHRDRIALSAPPVVVPGGEHAKNDDGLFRRVTDLLSHHRVDRQSFVVIVGGGAILDAVGFAASVFHRGVRVIRIPTTALAQNDSGVGVKTAINLGRGKNLIGTFAPPFAVLNDAEFLDTLPDREWKAGIAEAFKVAIIKDRAFFRELCRDAALLRRRSRPHMERLVRKCALLHLHHIRTGGDPFEFGRARPLDFGHWSAHKLETMTGYRINHGEAVAAGVALDTVYASLKDWLTAAERERILDGMRRSGLQLWYGAMAKRQAGRPEILDGLRDFQEHIGGELCLTFPDGIGRRRDEHEVDTGLMVRAMQHLRASAC